ncbi:MAG TPA: hypothetical protein VH234_04005 [Candidatus Saccharimonadales bacterium]|jgi:hypothetical protein|nr:hypothetical protein [Candidatus Saccharimonadales bacterium]
MLNKLDRWHKTKVGLLVFAIVELAIAYGFASLSIDRGNFWWYLLTLVFFVGFLQNLARLTGKFTHARRAN